MRGDALECAQGGAGRPYRRGVWWCALWCALLSACASAPPPTPDPTEVTGPVCKSTRGGLSLVSHRESPGMAARVATSLGACRVIEGDVRVEGRGGAAALAALSQIERIRGKLIIRAVSNMEPGWLAGLRALRRVDGDVIIERNRGLLNLRGLGLLRRVGGSLRIERNSDLSSLRGLEELERVDGDLRIERHSKLASLDGPRRLTQIGGSLTIQHASKLRRIEGFPALRRIGKNLHIQHNALAARLTLPPGLERLGWTLVVEEMSALREIAWPETLRRPGGVILRKLPALRVMRGRPFEEILGTVRLDAVPRLGDVSWLMRASRVVGSVHVRGDVSFPAGCVRAQLERSARVAGVVQVRHAASVVTIKGAEDARALRRLGCAQIMGDLRILRVEGASLPALGVRHVTGDLIVTDNAQLTTLDALKAVARVDGRVEVMGNAALASIDGLRALREARQGVVLRDNPALADARALSGLSAQVGGLLVQNMPSLRHMPALKLKRLRGDLVVEGVAALESLDAFAQLGEVTGDLSVIDAPKLRVVALPTLRLVRGQVRLGALPAVEQVRLPALADVWGDLLLWQLQAERVSVPALNQVRGRVEVDRRVTRLQQLKRRP